MVLLNFLIFMPFPNNVSSLCINTQDLLLIAMMTFSVEYSDGEV